MKTPDPDLRGLVDRWHDGTITPEEALRLEQRLAADEAARDYLFDIAEIEAAMPEAAARRPLGGAAVVPHHPRRGWWRVAAAFVAGAFLGPLFWKATTSSPPPAVARHAPAATVTGMLGVAWASHPDGGAVVLAAGSDEAKIDAGLVELTFASGVRAVIEGPAAFKVVGDNAMDLSLGRLVADVPKGAEGFVVNYPDGRLVDLGTEFGVEVLPGGHSANFGVFRGEIELHPAGDTSRPVLLRENHAVVAEGGEIFSVPFSRDKFTRMLPSREFAWEVPAAGAGDFVWDYDISHLVWRPGRYRAICKWMRGDHDVVLQRAELLLDGVPVDEDAHEGFVGSGTAMARSNAYELNASAERYRRGHWTLRIHGSAAAAPGASGEAAGVILVDDGSDPEVHAADFIGTWEYQHDGKVYHRAFHADGTASLHIDGQEYTHFRGGRWRVEGGLLLLEIPGNTWTREEHRLRDSQTLIFTNRPYREAKRTTR